MLVLLDGVWESSQGSGGSESSSKASSSSRDLEASSNGGETANNGACVKASVKGNGGTGNGWGSVDSSDSWGGSNRLDLDITLNSNQLGLLTHLGLDVLALLNDGSLNDGVGLSHAVGAGDGGALLVSDLPDGGGADLLGDGVANIVDLGLVLGVGHGVADTLRDGSTDSLRGGGTHSLWDSLALLGVLEVIDSLADWVGLDVVGVGPGVTVAIPAATVTTVSAPVAAVVLAVVGLSVGLRLAQGQWCNQAQKYKILIHFAFLKNLKHTSTNG